MLILSRKKAQKIIINGNIVITVVETRPHGVRLGIEAPDDVEILRDDAIKRTRGGNGIEDREDGLPRLAGTDGTEPPLSTTQSGAVPTTKERA